ncbi:NAD(P)-binding [Fusarium albosuccineum]|uniref:NAD(P)-binding n=1 Tax=Fusarium albosuccineum TaxID=1237068 RepID=A0A8H4L2D2_9HYPO|nr:NAD(P)-binding [Fusarium albosuccineum]
MGTVLIVGANRGIGLQLIRTFSKHGWHTIGSVRPETFAQQDPSIADLRQTGADIVEIDVKNETSIINAAKQLHDTKLDVLINCAGIKPRPLEWYAHEEEDLMERFQVMAVGPFLVVKHFMPLLSKGNGGKLVNISSGNASIGSPSHDGESIGYRMAKAALNQQTKTLSLDFKRDRIPVLTVAIAPGFIKTRLTDFRGRVDIKESSEGMYNIIENLTPEKSAVMLKHTSCLPIIFVVHSLGGLVGAKVVIVGERNANGDGVEAVAKRVKGLIFLGTPFAGSNVVKWGDIGRKIFKEESRDLQELGAAFPEVIRKHNNTQDKIHIVFFFETLDTHGTRIVEQRSASYPGIGEILPIRGNHISICKFDSRDDDGYKSVKAKILQIIRGDIQDSCDNRGGVVFNNYDRVINQAAGDINISSQTNS